MKPTDKMPLICLRCKKPIPLTVKTFEEVSYTHYSYCEDCLRQGLKLLKEADEKAHDFAKGEILVNDDGCFAVMTSNHEDDDFTRMHLLWSDGSTSIESKEDWKSTHRFIDEVFTVLLKLEEAE